MPRRTLVDALLMLFFVAGWTAAGEVGAETGTRPRKPHWSDALKDIPLGPFRFDIGGSVRLRLEYQSDFNIQRYADQRRRTARRDAFLLQRARLDFNLRFAEQARLYVELQDARVYDSDFRKDDFVLGCPYWNPFDLRQAYLEWLHIGGMPFGIKIGRQAIFYGDNRIWGPGEWGNVGRYTWDAIKLIADTELAEIHGIFANRIRYDPHSFDEHDSRLDAFGVYAMIKKLPFRLDLFWVGKRTRPEQVINLKGDTADLHIHTVGFYVDGRFGPGRRWDYGGTLARTFGHRNGARVEAYGANARLGYTFDLPWQPRIGVEYSHATGDPNPAGGNYETFDGVFGAIDRYYGRINFLSWMNLRDFQVSFSCKPLKKAKLWIDYHFFRLDERKDAWYWCSGRPARRDPSGRSGSDLGQELNIVLSYNFSERLRFMAGYAHFFPGSFIRRTGRSPGADWFFLQVVYSF